MEAPHAAQPSRAAAGTLRAPSTREHRMLTTLLATCDPCEYVDAGALPFRYNPIAGDVLRLLQRHRHSAADVVMLLPGEADASRAIQFAFAARDWWNNQQDARWRARGGQERRGLRDIDSV
jgi:hypothetical protein